MAQLDFSRALCLRPHRRKMVRSGRLHERGSVTSVQFIHIMDLPTRLNFPGLQYGMSKLQGPKYLPDAVIG